jgi:preprotein translocase subunit SecD
VVAYRNSQPVLRLRLTTEGGERLARLTSRNVGRVMAITLDGETLFEATVQGVLATSLEITGGELDELRALSVILQAGALPEGVTTRVAPAKAR